MKLKLKEDPGEWQKYLLAMVFIIDAILGIMLARGRCSAAIFRGIQPALALGLAAGLGRPRWFRGLYRVGMTGNYYVGKVIGRVMLTVFFFVIITPLGLLLRLTGKDLLKLRRDNLLVLVISILQFFIC